MTGRRCGWDSWGWGRRRCPIVEHGEAEVGDAFLGADGDDGFGFAIEVDVVATLVPVADGLAQRGSRGERVAVGRGFLCGLDELVDDMLGRGAVGLPMPKSMMSSRACGGGFEFACDVEYVGGEAGQSSKLFHWVPFVGAISIEAYACGGYLAVKMIFTGRVRAGSRLRCRRLILERRIHCMVAGVATTGRRIVKEPS